MKEIRQYYKNYYTSYDEEEIKDGQSTKNLYCKQSISQNSSLMMYINTNKQPKFFTII